MLNSAITVTIAVKTAKIPDDTKYEQSPSLSLSRLEKDHGGIKVRRRTRQTVDTRRTFNVAERSLGSIGSGVVTMMDGIPNIRVREARIVWNSTGLMSEGIEGIEPCIDIRVLFWKWMAGVL